MPDSLSFFLSSFYCSFLGCKNVFYRPVSRLDRLAQVREPIRNGLTIVPRDYPIEMNFCLGTVKIC